MKRSELTATGARLDRMGSIVNVARDGRGDDEYREAMLAALYEREERAQKEFWGVELPVENVRLEMKYLD